MPFTVRATVSPNGDGWVLTDRTGSLPLLRPAHRGSRSLDRSLAVLLAVSGGNPVDLTCEWTPHGVVALTIHQDSRVDRHRSSSRRLVRERGMNTAAISMQDHWDELVAVAMLGTDRRNPPDAPEPIADVVDDTVRERPSDRMLAQVAATVTARRPA